MHTMIQTEREPNLWTVGFTRPDGHFESLSDHIDEADAISRVALLNGSAAVPLTK